VTPGLQFQRLNSLGLCIVYPEDDISFSCPAAKTVANGASGYFCFSGFAPVQLYWELLETTGIKVGSTVDEALVVCAVRSLLPSGQTPALLKHLLTLTGTLLWLRGPSLNKRRDQTVLLCLHVRVGVLLGQC